MIQDSFRVQFCIKDIACKEDVDKWLSKLGTSSNIKYNTETWGHARKGKRVLFAGQYICQCKRKKLTKKQEDAKKKAQQRKQLRRQGRCRQVVITTWYFIQHKIQYRSWAHARKGKRILFAGQYICQCKRKKLTKKTRRC